MRNDLSHVDYYRVKTGSLATKDGERHGAFILTGKDDFLTVIVSSELGWDHASVSTPSHSPSWRDMCLVKDIFFEDEECVIQYHPPKSIYLNMHPNVLHMWRPHYETIPIPPAWMV